MHDIIIIGGGPAGLTAALYALRAGKSVLVIEKSTFGGQITWSPKVENFPGIPSVSGAELGDKFTAQALEQGAELELDEVISVELDGDIKRVKTDFGGTFEAKALIIASGARPRTLGIPGEEELMGAGVCFCAVCDGAFYKGREVAVNGGGNYPARITRSLSAATPARRSTSSTAETASEARQSSSRRSEQGITSSLC